MIRRQNLTFCYIYATEHYREIVKIRLIIIANLYREVETVEDILFAKRPLMLYVGIILVFLVFIFLLFKDWSIAEDLVFSTIFCIIYYYLLLRFSCRIFINQKGLKILYDAPWLSERLINLNSMRDIDYMVSFWDMNESYKKSRNFKNICFDTLIVYLKDGSVEEININTRMSFFHKAMHYINNGIISH